MNQQLSGIVQKMVAFKSAMMTGGNVNKAYASSMQQSAKATKKYAIDSSTAKGATNAMTTSMQRAAAWTRQMAIGLYVVGGAATSIARPLIAVSMILSTYDKFELEWAWFDRWRARVTKGMASVGKAMKSALLSVISTLRVLKIRFRLMIRQIPGVQAALHSLRMTLASFGLTVNAFLGWIGAIVAVLAVVGFGAAKLSKKFAPISEHIQRTISVSSLAQDQFNNLADSIFRLTDSLEVFKPEEIASMVERMAYAGAIGDQFEETAKMIGQIAYVTGIEMAEITRDMARLTSQTGQSFHDMSNVILRTFAQASITYEETVEAFQQAGMLLREDLGVTIDQMGAIVVQLEKFGYTGTRAATALRSLAARSSELKEGLRSAQQIISELGISEAVEKFQEGEQGLVELIKAMGDAGASYGHFVQMFNRRAGVAAAAVAEFAEEHEEAAEKIKNGTADITEMYKELIQTQQGVRQRVESQRALATQQWARALSGVGKSWLYVMETVWKVVGALSGVFRILSTIAQVGIGILIEKFNLAIWPIHAIIGGLRLVHNIITSLLNLIPGLQIDMDFKDIPGIGWLAKAQDVLIKGGFNFFKGAWSSIKGFWQDQELEVTPEQRRQQEHLDKATKEYEKQIIKTSDAMKEFSGIFTSEFINSYVTSLDTFSSNIDTLSATIDTKGKEIEDALEKQAYAAEGMKMGEKFDEVTGEIIPVVSSLIKLNKASTYVKDKFDDLTDELEDMFGLSRTIQRRGGAVVQETGERIGQVRGATGGMTEKGRAMREYLGPERFKTAKQFISKLGGVTDNFFATVVGEMQEMEPDVTAQEAIMQKVMEQLLGVDIGGIREEREKVENFYKRLFNAVQMRDLTAKDFADIDLPMKFANLQAEKWEDLTKEQRLKMKQFRNEIGSIQKLLDRLPATGYRLDVPEGKEGGGGWLQGIVNFLKFWEAPKAHAAEGSSSRGQYGGMMGKIATTVQQLANATEDFTEQVSALETQGITVSSESLGKISGGKTTRVTVDISQVFENEYDLDISSDGIEGDTKAMIRRAISRAANELEQTVRSSVDPEALEQKVIEKIEDEVEKNEEEGSDEPLTLPGGGQTTPG